MNIIVKEGIHWVYSKRQKCTEINIYNYKVNNVTMCACLVVRINTNKACTAKWERISQICNRILIKII